MKRILIGYAVRPANSISIAGCNLLRESGFDISEDRRKFGIIIDADENDGSIDEMLKVMVNTKAKYDSDFNGFVSRCTKGEWEIWKNLLFLDII